MLLTGACLGECTCTPDQATGLQPVPSGTGSIQDEHRLAGRLTPGHALLLGEQVHRGAQRDGELQPGRIVGYPARGICQPLQCSSIILKHDVMASCMVHPTQSGSSYSLACQLGLQGSAVPESFLHAELDTPIIKGVFRPACSKLAARCWQPSCQCLTYAYVVRECRLHGCSQRSCPGLKHVGRSVPVQLSR